MGKRYSFCFTAILACVFSVFSSVVYTLPRETVHITRNQDGITLFRTELPTLSLPGKPVLPCYHCTFLLPYNADLSSVAVTVTGSSEQIFPGTFELQPGKPYLVDNQEVWSGVTALENGKDLSVYRKNAFFPRNNVFGLHTGMMRAYKLVKATVTPFSYNPVTRQLKRIRDAKVIIDYKTVAVSPRNNYAPPNSIKNIARSLAVNFREFAVQYDNYFTRRATERAGYLIITSESIQGSLSSLQTFIDGKEKHGFAVTVVTESEWGGGSGDAAADNIRAWLQENYESMGVEYVLFIGHPSQGAVPMKLTWPDNSDRHKAYIDYFYGDLSGDWDVNNDGKFGVWGLGSSGDNTDGGCDLFGEVHVGRIPVYGSTSETDAILMKIHNYSMANPSSIDWRKKVYLPLGDFEFNDGATLGNALVSKVFSPNNWPHIPLYGSSCSYSAVTGKWNSEQFGLMIWQGHGMPDYTQNVMSTSQSAQLDDTYPAHCYQISCHNGKPERSDNLGYAILKNAGVSTIASAVQVLYSATMKELGTSGSTRHWAYMYAKQLIEAELPSGAAYNAARPELPVIFSTDWLNCVEMNLYGCPAVGVFTNSGSTVAEKSVDAKEMHYGYTFTVSPIHGQGIRFHVSNRAHRGGFVSIYTATGEMVARQCIPPGAVSCRWHGQNSRNAVISHGVYFAECVITDMSGKSVQETLKFGVH